MKTLHGIATSDGYAIGSVHMLSAQPAEILQLTTENPAKELDNLQIALGYAKEELRELYETALNKVGAAAAEIFSVHSMLLDDPDYAESITSNIQDAKMSAQAAVRKTGEEFSEMFALMDDAYMKERAADIKDISERLIRKLCYGRNQSCETAMTEPYVAAAEDLTPSQTVSLNKSLIQAIVTGKGSQFSHSAILARIMGIPAVVDVGEGLRDMAEGQTIIVDGKEGIVIVDPDAETLEQYRQKREAFCQYRAELAAYASKAAETKDGRRVEICANAADVSDAEAAKANGAEGIGLFRSEFLYMDRTELPSEEEQFLAYKQIVEAMNPGRVIIRTLDIGADKHTDCLNLPKEENPALGYRAIRICLDQKDMFRTQLRALLRASAYGRLAVMLPMIVSEEEVRQARAMTEEIRAELIAQGIPVAEKIEWGVMIETPASVIMSDRLAELVDFFSIGTNDLIQYTMACDRMNAHIGHLYDAMNPAVLRMIQQTIQNAHKAGIWVGMCGEAAADIRLTPILLKLGLDEFSAAPGSLLKLKKQIMETDISQVILPKELTR